MQTEHTYRVVGAQPYASLVVLAILTAAVPVVVIQAVDNRSNRWFDILWAGVIAWFWYAALFRFAYRIELAGNSVEFRSLARRRHTELGAIRSIRASQADLVTIKYEGGRADIFGPIDGFYDFVNRVKERNPAVELRGV